MKLAGETGLAIQAPRARSAERGASETMDPFPPCHPPSPGTCSFKHAHLGSSLPGPMHGRSRVFTHNASGWLLRGSEPPLSWAHFPKSLQPAHYRRLITHLRRQTRAQHGQGQLVQRICVACPPAANLSFGIWDSQQEHRALSTSSGRTPAPGGLSLPVLGTALWYQHLSHHPWPPRMRTNGTAQACHRQSCLQAGTPAVPTQGSVF